MKRSLMVVAGLCVALPGVALAQESSAKPPAKVVVKTAADLPVHEYTITGKASEFLVSDQAFKEFVAKVKADALADLAKYDIQDKTTLQGYHSLLSMVAMFEGDLARVPVHVDAMRTLEGKESKKLMTGQTLMAYVAASKAAGTDKAAFAKAFRETLRANVSKLPYETVAEDMKQAKGMAQLISRDLILGQVSSGLDPVVEQAKGTLSSDLANGLVRMRVMLDKMIEVQPMVAEVYSEIVDAHAAPRADTWTPTLVTLASTEKATPVVVAIWDSGVDTAVFSNNLYINPKESPNGRDDDQNGFIDDVHGVAWDLHGERTPELLCSVDEMKSEKALVVSHTKGLSDLQSSIESKEADALKGYIKSLKSDQVGNFLEDLGLFGNYSHGTHVAGIAAAGNPFARVLPVRLTFDYRQIPLLAPSEELSRKTATMYTDAVNYMRGAGVRVTNMSWGGSLKDIEEGLERKGVGQNAEDRKAIAARCFKIERDALDAAMRSAPEILFIAAAGNSDNDNQFAELIPSGLSLPNMITVGAIDSAGKPTGFTTFGKNVSLYANGFEVESSIPGGERMKYSGTSMAAPNAANLVAKILALNPKLTTDQVKELLTKGADPMTDYEGRFIINPKKTLELVRRGS